MRYALSGDVYSSSSYKEIILYFSKINLLFTSQKFIHSFFHSLSPFGRVIKAPRVIDIKTRYNINNFTFLLGLMQQSRAPPAFLYFNIKTTLVVPLRRCRYIFSLVRRPRRGTFHLNSALKLNPFEMRK